MRTGIGMGNAVDESAMSGGVYDGTNSTGEASTSVYAFVPSVLPPHPSDLHSGSQQDGGLWWRT